MTNNDELALKARIERALEDFTNVRACMHVPPLDTDVDMVLGDFLALLAERESDKKQLESWRNLAKQNIAEHEKAVIALDAARLRIRELETVSAAAEKLVRCKGRYHSEQNYRVLAALFGVSTPDLPPLETEARTVSVKLPPVWFDGEGPVMNADEVRAILIEAGIKLEVGE
ncbi:hypothetical protein [Kosakonia cowanii]|uniref:hypothetical protein n=1 Tax=Kosakonia cowanii TaxID=208223 RepID=UPI0028A028B3|nr:hypothetical protein [Kosakonia cowanii]